MLILSNKVSMGLRLNQLIPELSIFDLEKSLDFYVNVLKFSIGYQRKEEGFALLILGDAQIMIDQIRIGRTWQTGKFHYPLGRGINFQIKVARVASLLNRLKHFNIDLFLKVEEKWYSNDNCEVGQKQFLIMDPDGYLLRFVEDLGVRPIQLK